MPQRYLLWSTHLTKEWLSGIAWRFSRSNADISIGIQGWNKLVKSELGPSGQCCCGESLSANTQETLSPSSTAVRSATLLFHSDFGGPVGSSLDVWTGGRLPQAWSDTAWAEDSTQSYYSVPQFWKPLLGLLSPRKPSKTLHNCMVSNPWFHLHLEKTVIKC